MDDTDGATLSELDIYVADVLSPPTADPAAPGRELCVCVCVCIRATVAISVFVSQMHDCNLCFLVKSES